MQTTETYIIAGLGNPGPEYERTRHNCGFKTVDRLTDKLGANLTKHKFQALCGDVQTEVRGEKARVLIMKPEPYMNSSGEAIREAADFYKVRPENIIVICDDCDIALGAIRIRKAGSGGTHNGMKSVVKELGTENFLRVRVGIGQKMPNADMIKFVLGTFPPDEEKPMEEAFEKAAEAILCILKKGADYAMNQFNTRK